MSRLQLALNVDDLDASIPFYSALFGTGPAKTRPGYANFAVAEPPLKLVLIENPGQGGSLNHLGVEVEDVDRVDAELERLTAAGFASTEERDTTCCYARSDKNWTEDPQGTRWETFHTHGEATSYYAPDAACATDGAACTPDVREMKPKVEKGAACCAPQSGCC